MKEKMELETMLHDTADILAGVSEDLAIEILAEFQEDDFPHLEKTMLRLMRAEGRLIELKAPVPPAVVEVLRHYRGGQTAN